MAMRITNSMVTAQTINYSQRQQGRLGVLQEQLISGQRINRPSDDPLAYRSLLDNISTDSRLTVQLENVNASRVRLETGLSQVTRAKDILVHARDQASTGINAADDRVTLARSVEQALDSLMDIANFHNDGAYVFAGTASDNQPFAVDEFRGRPRVTYQGSDANASTMVSVNIQVDVLYRGDEVFQARDRGDTIYLGETGITAGLGVDSAIGRGAVLLRNTGTTYAPGSGVASGTSAASTDTIIGSLGTHRLFISDTSGTGASGTVRLDSGPEISFTSSDTNLIVNGIGGEKVSLDMSSITAGFTGFVDITATGEMSIDGGATYQTVNFADNEQLVDSVTGAVTYVDTRQVRAAGTAYVEYDGTTDAFSVLSDLADDLRDTRDLPEAELVESIGRRIGDLNRLIEHMISVVGEQSVTLENLEQLEVRHEDLQLNTQQVISEIASTDTATAILNLQNTQNLLNLTYASSVTLMDQSLLNFLR